MRVLDAAGSIASIIGLIVSLFLLWRVIRLGDQLLTRGRLPAQSRSLRAASRNLRKLIEAKDWDSVRSELAKCGGSLHEVVERVPKKSDLRLEVQELEGQIQRLSERAGSLDRSRDQLDRILAALDRICSRLDDHVKDMPWTLPQ